VVVKIDISHIPDNLKAVILNGIETDEDNSEIDTKESDYNNSNPNNNIVTLNNENNIRRAKQKIKDILIKKRIREYVAVDHDKEENMILILKKNHAEKFGIYHCPHCGMAFDSEIQLSTHQRIHYLI